MVDDMKRYSVYARIEILACNISPLSALALRIDKFLSVFIECCIQNFGPKWTVYYFDFKQNVQFRSRSIRVE